MHRRLTGHSRGLYHVILSNNGHRDINQYNGMGQVYFPWLICIHDFSWCWVPCFLSSLLAFSRLLNSPGLIVWYQHPCKLESWLGIRAVSGLTSNQMNYRKKYSKDDDFGCSSDIFIFIFWGAQLPRDGYQKWGRNPHLAMKEGHGATQTTSVVEKNSQSVKTHDIYIYTDIYQRYGIHLVLNHLGYLSS